jgi:hypothetical protein
MALGMFPRARKVQSELLSAALRLFGRVPLIPGRGAPLAPFHPRQSRPYRRHHLTLDIRLLARVSTSGCRYHILLPSVRFIYSTQGHLPITPRVLTRSRNPENLGGFTHQGQVSSCIRGDCISFAEKPRSTCTSAVAHREHTQGRTYSDGESFHPTHSHCRGYLFEHQT